MDKTLDKTFLQEKLQNFYRLSHVNTKQKVQPADYDSKYFIKTFQTAEISVWNKLKLFTFLRHLSCCQSKRDKFHRKAMKLTDKEIEKSLDIRTIFNQQRAFKALTNALLTKNA